MKRSVYPYRWLMLLLMLVVGVVVAPGQTKREQGREQFNKVWGSQALNEDIDLFYNALEAGHPDLYRYLPKPQLDSMIAALKAKSGTLTLRQFYNELNQIASLIGCGHLLVSYAKPLEKYFTKYAYYPPLHLEVYNGTAVVRKNLLGENTDTNAIVTAINGVRIDSLVAGMHRYLTRDGYSLAATTWMLEEGWFNEFYIRYWADSSTYTYQMESLTGSGWVNTSTTLQGLDYATMKFPKRKRQKPEPELTLTFDEDTRTAILTLHTFDPIAISKGRQKFNKFIREAFWRIYQTQPDQLIIDLRDNEGGNSFYPEVLIGFLSDVPFRLYRDMEIRYRSQSNKQPLLKIKGKRGYSKMEKKSVPIGNGNLAFRQFTDRYVNNFPYAYAGTVYVMVNGGTYSAASELACYLKEHVAAVVVGTETGGSCDQVTAGMYGSATLPNTGIVLHVPLITFHKDIKQPRQPGCGLLPDIEQHQTSPRPTKDKQLTELLELIEKQKNRP